MSRPNPSHTFLLEAEELLEQVEQTVLEIKPGEEPGEAVHHLFRAFHTIKGSGAMFGFDKVAEFTHHVETVLDQVRAGAVPVSPELVSLILASKDQIQVLLESAQAGITVSRGDAEALIASLNQLLPVAPAPGEAPPTRPAESSPRTCDTANLQTFVIHFQPSPGLMASGTNPRMLLNELRALGQCAITARTDAIPSLELLQADHCYLAWDITLETSKGLDAIKDVFIFVEDESRIIIESGNACPAEQGKPVVSPEKEGGAPGLASSSPPSHRPNPNAIEAAPTAPEARSPDSRKAAAKEATVRVPSDRLDRLVKLVGELVMNQSRLTQVAASVESPHLRAPVEELERLVAELRDNVLGIRMMPIGTTFSRFKRLVHDLSAELGKEIDLVTEGGETELDKTVIDQLGDPLVHLIRNSIDHGIEPAEERAQSGKPRRGMIRLAAGHTGAHVVLTIQDDGRGLDPQRIRAKAIEQHLIAPDAALSLEEIYQLIFLPGFSTASRVTKVSGRGVGMDVVKRQVEALRGSIQLVSAAGQGTTVSLTLPLTLAIIDGLLVEIGRDQFIIPMAAVSENVELTQPERQANNGRKMVVVRGELVPYIRLRDLFGVSGSEPEIEKIVIVNFNHRRVGLVVDRVVGSHQTVIQSLNRFYRGVELFSGTTIMGDGRVAMIFDLAGIIRRSTDGISHPLELNQKLLGN